MSRALTLTPEAYEALLSRRTGWERGAELTLPPPPDERVGALNDPVHLEVGRSRVPTTVKSSKPLKLTSVEATESVIQDAIIKRLVLHPMVREVFRVNVSPMVRKYVNKQGKEKQFFVRSVVGYSRKYGKREKGFSDIWVLRTDGRMVFIEVKKRDEVTAGNQVAFLDQTAPYSGVARSIDDAVRIIEGDSER